MTDTPPSVSGTRSQLEVVLVEPEIHWNTGNIGRTCLAFDAKLHLVRPLGFSLDAAKLRRAGLDYWSRVDLTIWDSWEDCERELIQSRTAETHLSFFSAEARHSLWSFSPRTANCRHLLVFGSESRGFSRTLRQQWQNHLVAIPSNSAVRSLNLSNAVTIAVHHFSFLAAAETSRTAK